MSGRMDDGGKEGFVKMQICSHRVPVLRKKKHVVTDALLFCFVSEVPYKMGVPLATLELSVTIPVDRSDARKNETELRKGTE